MNLIPEWAPNVHPLLVHFPIALLFTAVLFDIAGLFKRESRVLKDLPLVLYVLGSVGAVLTYFSGRRAADSVDIPLQAVTTLNEHADLGLYTLLLFGIYTIIRLVLTLRFDSDNVALRIVAIIVPLVGLQVLWHTAEHGAELVFKYGIGVTGVEPPEPEPEPIDPASISHVRFGDGGSWSWRPGTGAAMVLADEFDFVSGSLDSLVVHESDSSLVIDIRPGGAVMFVTGEPSAGLEMVTTMNLDAFEGEALLVHNVTDSDNYDYFGVDGGNVVHGRIRSGDRTSYGTSSWGLDGVVEFKSVSAGTHFRGYTDGSLATHGHGSASPAGRSGILVKGSGRIELSSVRLTTIE